MLRASCSRSYQRLRPSTVIKPWLGLDNNSNKNNNTHERRKGSCFTECLPFVTARAFSGFSSDSTTLSASTLLALSSRNTLQWNARRNFSVETTKMEGESLSSDDTSNISSNSETSVDDALERLFAESANGASGGPVMDALLNVWEPTWYNVADQAIVVVNFFHQTTGLEIGWSIICVTFLLRASLFPLMIMAQRNSSRMAHLQPQLKAIQKRYEQLKAPTRQDQMNFSENMRKLFKQYECNPLKGIWAPLVQFPAFMGMFFGLRKMGEIFPEEMSKGGLFWFPDLTLSDPLYALPVLTSITFIGLTEMSKDQMVNSGGDPATGQMLLNFMRAMSVVMLPVVFNFHTAMLLYWTTNNILTMTQTKLLDTKAVRTYFGIWERPKPIPGQEVPSLKDQMGKIWKQVKGEPVDEATRMKLHNREIEVQKRAKARREAMNEER